MWWLADSLHSTPHHKLIYSTHHTPIRFIITYFNLSPSPPTTRYLQLFPIPGNAQAKIEDVSRLLLNQVSQMPSKMPSSLAKVTTTGSNSQPFADMTKKLAVSNLHSRTYLYSYCVFLLIWMFCIVFASTSSTSSDYKSCFKTAMCSYISES